MRLTALMSMAARVVVPKDYRYGTNRPWTEAAKRLNPPGKKRRKVFVEPIAPEDWSVLRGDTVSRILNPLLTEITQNFTLPSLQVESFDGQVACTVCSLQVKDQFHSFYTSGYCNHDRTLMQKSE